MELNNKEKKILVTHNGTFHCDDVFAAAALSLLLEKKNQKFKIIRTRDEEIIKNGDYIFDVGGIYNPNKNKFDHHQVSFAENRKNTIPYSSFGLVWKKYGKEICGTTDVMEHIDKMLVEQIDATDNGVNVFKPTTTHIFNYDISTVSASFLPVWGEEDSPRFFKNAVKFARHILEKEIKQFTALLKAKKIVNLAYKKSKDKRILVLDTEIPRYLVDVATNEYKNLLFIVFKNKNNWTVLAVREKAGAFKNKKNLPKAWAGLNNEKFQKISGVSDAIFCHRGLFLAVAKSKAGAEALVILALKN